MTTCKMIHTLQIQGDQRLVDTVSDINLKLYPEIIEIVRPTLREQGVIGTMGQYYTVNFQEANAYMTSTQHHNEVFHWSVQGANIFVPYGSLDTWIGVDESFHCKLVRSMRSVMHAVRYIYSESPIPYGRCMPSPINLVVPWTIPDRKLEDLTDTERRTYVEILLASVSMGA